MKDDRELRINITPRARAIYAKLLRAKNENERLDLQVALHAAVGLFPWQYMPVEELLAAFEHEPRAHQR
jgi:hypothetical protein